MSMFRDSFVICFFTFHLFTLNLVFSQEVIETGNIEVTIENIDTEEKGKLVIMLFDSEDTWLEAGQYYKILKIKPLIETEKVIFTKIPYGSDYAIEVIHDENENMKMDMRILPYPKPKEGVGVSNNTFRAGPPEYQKAKFELKQKFISLTIHMKY